MRELSMVARADGSGNGTLATVIVLLRRESAVHHLVNPLKVKPLKEKPHYYRRRFLVFEAAATSMSAASITTVFQFKITAPAASGDEVLRDAWNRLGAYRNITFRYKKAHQSS